MIRIRCITSFAVPVARDRIAQVERIFAESSSKLAGYTDKIPELLANPFKHDYQTALIVSETSLGFNYNTPLPPNTDDAAYARTLEKALARVDRFRPDFLVVSFGLDILKGDPTGTFLLSVDTLGTIARSLARRRYPTLVVQEGGV